MRLIAIAAAGILFAGANALPASPLDPIRLAQTQQQTQPAPTQQQKQKSEPSGDQKGATKQEKNAPKAAPMKDETKKKDDTVMQKVKRTWRNWTTPSHTFCVRSPIPIPLTSKTCTAKGKTVEEARSVCVKQNPLSYVTAGRC